MISVMHLIDGKTLAAKIRGELKEMIAREHLAPRLEILLIGNNPASELYVALKKKAAEEIGATVHVQKEIATANEDALIKQIIAWNHDGGVDGILVQVPLPSGLDQDRILQTIDSKKDVDGFHAQNIAALMAGEPQIVPPVHLGILRLIGETPVRLSGAQAVILANSETFAAPLARLLKTAGASVDVFFPDNLDKSRLAEADIIIIAVGREAYLHASMAKPTAVIIDVGTNKTVKGKIRGDADTESFSQTDAWISPVPGGVGPLTIAELLRNVTIIAEQKKRAA